MAVTFMQCDNCKDGRHRIEATPDGECLSKRDMLPVHCGCWCLTPDMPRIALTRFRPMPAGTDYALDVLRRYHIQVRTRRSNGLLVWKPSPKDLPAEILAEIRANKFGLQMVLAAHTSTLGRPRDGWTYHALDACGGCGKGCAVHDPLGYCRHSWCGWLGQVPVVEPIVQVPGYPQIAAMQRAAAEKGAA